jgi:hypothetical protein
MVFLYVKTRLWRAYFIHFTCFYYIDYKEMARRRQEIALQTELETQEEWNDAINKEGLTGDKRYPIHNSIIIFSFL